MAEFKKVAVLGAGVMGSGIAAHLAGAGIQVLLLDIVPPDGKGGRNAFAAGGKEKALKAKPAAFFTPRDADLIAVGNLEDDLDKPASATSSSRSSKRISRSSARSSPASSRSSPSTPSSRRTPRVCRSRR